jgi:glutamyl-tRNA synthetase
VRTVLYNYLFARQHKGTFVLRIEDTDQSRYVEGAEEYIYNALAWCGLEPDESPKHGGQYEPYRQSERKELYRKYAEELVKQGYAYYAFDSPQDLEDMRNRLRTDENPNPQYDHHVRNSMRNSLTLSEAETSQLLEKGERHVIRIRMPEDETVRFTDMIRGEVSFETKLVDDKVLLKADGMPTYHLAVVVDDHLMEITHAFRGEEWLPSAPVHILLWKYLFGLDKMPQWAHLPLILGPSGKLSKRDAMKYGFPVFAMNWKDPKSGELTEGFKERGFLPEAFINLLAMLGWNDGTDQEIFSLDELVQKFTIDHIHKGGAKFDFEKAKWFNHEWIKRSSVDRYFPQVRSMLQEKGLKVADDDQLKKIMELVKDRCTLLTDFYDHSFFFFDAPKEYDTAAVLPKWNPEKKAFFEELATELKSITEWNSAFIENAFKQLAAIKGIKPGELQLPFRIMLVGGKFGPTVFDIAEIIGVNETVRRIEAALKQFA